VKTVSDPYLRKGGVAGQGSGPATMFFCGQVPKIRVEFCDAAQVLLLSNWTTVWKLL
jgi:hypothetical protein